GPVLDADACRREADVADHGRPARWRQVPVLFDRSRMALASGKFPGIQTPEPEQSSELQHVCEFPDVLAKRLLYFIVDQRARDKMAMEERRAAPGRRLRAGRRLRDPEIAAVFEKWPSAEMRIAAARKQVGRCGVGRLPGPAPVIVLLMEDRIRGKDRHSPDDEPVDGLVGLRRLVTTCVDELESRGDRAGSGCDERVVRYLPDRHWDVVVKHK